MELIKYDAAKTALAKLVKVDEVKNIRDQSIAVEAYARQAKDMDMLISANLVRLMASRRLGELINGMKKVVNQHGSGGSDSDPATLDSLGIDKHLADEARKAACIEDENFESMVSLYRQSVKPVSISELLRKPHISHNSVENEWYTPPEFIEAARTVLNGIDLDPASSKAAQRRVQAKRFYTIEDDGLSKSWKGSVWMNPPYETSAIESFIEKLIEHHLQGNVPEAILLVNNATETKWFQLAMTHALGICFPKSRIRFLDKDGERKLTPLQGQAFLYFGDDGFMGFWESFREFGCVAEIP